MALRKFSLFLASCCGCDSKTAEPETKDRVARDAPQSRMEAEVQGGVVSPPLRMRTRWDTTRLDLPERIRLRGVGGGSPEEGKGGGSPWRARSLQKNRRTY